MEAVLTWLLEHVPELGIFVAVSIAVFFLTRYFSRLDAGHKEVVRKVEDLPCNGHKDPVHDLQDVKSKVDNLPCDIHKDSIKELEGMKTTVNSINDQVTEISKWIMRLDGGMIDSLARKCSPRKLTKMGRELFDISGGCDVLNNNNAFFISEMEAKQPKTAFDVENVALDVLFSNIGNPIFNGIKNYIYYQPEIIKLRDDNDTEQDVKISLNIIVRLMSIELRDRYLSIHPEIESQQE